MSREAYSIPTASQTSNSGLARPSSFATSGDVAKDNGIEYLCGDCGRPQSIRKQDPIRCVVCGCRVLYKQRTNR